MKNILIYTENYDYGGLEKFLFDFIKNTDVNIYLLFNRENDRIHQFARENHLNYRILNIKNNKHLPQFKIGLINKIVNGLSIFKIYLDIFLNYKILLKVFKSQHSFENLFIINGGYPAANSCRSAAIAAKKSGIKNVVFSILSNPPLKNNFKTDSRKTPVLPQLLDFIFNTINRFIDNKVIKSVDNFHVNCDATKRNLILLRYFPDQKIKTVYTGISIPKQSEITKISRLQNDFITLVKNPGEIWIGTIGLLYRLKGQEYFVRAMKIVINAGFQNLRWFIVGDGPDYGKLTQLSKKLGIEQFLILTGKYPYEISEIYRVLDLFVLTSLHEGLPYVISEAMAYKLPIISTNVGGIPEQIKEGVNGCLVEKANPQALAKKIIWMIENRKKWEEMGENAYNRVQESFSIVAMVHGMNDLMI